MHHVLASIVIVLLLAVSTADAACAVTIISGGGRGLADARSNAQLAVERDRNDKSEACGNLGLTYGPSHAGTKDANGCLTNFQITTGGGITVTGNGSFTGTLSAATPTAASHVTTKAYVDAAVASVGGGGSVRMCAATIDTYTGALGGFTGANTKCQNYYGTGWYFAQEYKWVQTALAPYSPQSWTGYVNNCNSWTSSSGSTSGGYTSTTSGIAVGNAACNGQRPIWCCNFNAAGTYQTGGACTAAPLELTSGQQLVYVPDNCTKATVVAVGSGGGQYPSGNYIDPCYGYVLGGGGGAYSGGIYDVAPGDQVSIVIGSSNVTIQVPNATLVAGFGGSAGPYDGGSGGVASGGQVNFNGGNAQGNTCSTYNAASQAGSAASASAPGANGTNCTQACSGTGSTGVPGVGYNAGAAGTNFGRGWTLGHPAGSAYVKITWGN